MSTKTIAKSLPRLTRVKAGLSSRVKAGKTPKQLLAPGHRACAGCGQMIAARAVVETLGSNTIIANATGCLEVTTTPYPESAWGMPWIHSLFENPSAIASGIRAALNYKQNHYKSLPREARLSAKLEEVGEDARRAGGGIKVVAQGGDGATFDIGFGLISGMWERKENILYVCYDNEAYMNTGIQASGATPYGANTTTSPTGSQSFGSQLRKKDMIAIALAHRVPYIAQTTAGYIEDIKTKIKRAMEIEGPAYLQILVPCIPGWKINSAHTIKIGKLAAQTGFYPVIEFINGQLTNTMKISQPQIKIDEYLKIQGRFKHLLKTPEGKEQIKFLQQMVDENIEKYNLK